MPDLQHDPRAIRWLNVAFLTVLPAVAVAGTVWYAAVHGVGWREPLAALVMWILTGLGITAGYHRLFSHRTYKATPLVRLLFAVCGGAAAQNSVVAWASDHRRHHACVDTDQDPYDARRGFFWSHMGWVMRDGYWGHDAYTNVPDLLKDPVLRHQHEHYLLWAVLANAAMFGIAGALTGLWWGMFVIAVLLRIVVVQHFTFLINSLAHMWGSQPFSAANSSRDNWILSLLTMGEGYHNYHHAFETDYRNGLAWYAWDPSKWLIYGLSRLGLANDLRRTPEDVVLRRRFEEGRRTLTERLEAWGEAKAVAWATGMNRSRDELVARFEQLMEQLRGDGLEVEAAEELRRTLHARAAELRAQLAGQAEELRAQVIEQIRLAEEAVEEALKELRQRRQAWTRSARARAAASSAEMRAAARVEVRELERSWKEARRAAREAIAGWEAAVDAYRQQFEALPSAA